MKPLFALDDVCARLCMHVDRALFVSSELADEAGETDFSEAEPCITALTAERMEMRANIVHDYLYQICNELKELCDIQEQLNKEQREGC